MKLKDGKKPIATKPTNPSLEGYIPMNALDVPPKLKKQIEAEGYEFRWINAARLRHNSGFHKNFWQPYEVDYAKLGLPEFMRGTTPNNHLIRGDSVLAVRPVEIGNRHRAQLQRRASRLKAAAGTKGIQEMKQMAKDSGGSIQVHEGYGKDDEE